MKSKCYILLAAMLASGAVFAQSSVKQTAEADFVMSSARTLSATQTAAARGLGEFAARFADSAGELPPGFPLDVRDLGELRNATIGWGFQVYDVPGDALQSGGALESSARPTGIWRYEVVLHGRPIGLVTLETSTKGWQVVSVGGAGLVNDIDAVVSAHGKRPGTALRYLRVPQATADFIQVKRGTAQAQFAPLQAAREMLKETRGSKAGLLGSAMAGSTADEGDLMEGGELSTQLREVVARNATY